MGIFKKKRLFFDIETSPNIGFFWSSGYRINVPYQNIIRERAIICISYKWADEDKVYHLSWDDKQDDKALLEAFIPIANKAAEVVGHNCVLATHKVLKSDLEWVEAGSLKSGDKLVAFDEGLEPGENTKGGCKSEHFLSRAFKEAEVTSNFIQKAKCMKVTFDTGEEVITTHDHYWLAMPYKENMQKWRKTSDLKVGYRVVKHFEPWEKDNTYDGGWLSGFLSGEGSFKSFKNSNSAAGIAFYQRPGITWEKAIGICNNMGLEISIDQGRITSGLGKGDCLTARIRGGKLSAIEIIGKLNIGKFKQNIDWNDMGFLKTKGQKVSTIVKIEEVGEQDVAVLSTSTKTFIAEGFAMHNCDKFDLPWVRTRCLLHGIPCFPSYTTIDTLTQSRSKFRFNSNRLDYIAQYLGLGEKMETGFDLWKDIVLKDDRKALDKMVKYCDNDVILLEKIYNRLSNYIPHKTHYGVLNGESKGTCPECGSSHLTYVQTRYTALGTARVQLQCRDCKKYHTVSERTYELVSKD